MDNKPFADKEWARFRKVYKLELAETRKLTNRELDIQSARTFGPRGYTDFFRLVATVETLKVENARLKGVLEGLIGASQKAHIAYMTNPKAPWIPAMDDLFKTREQAQTALEAIQQAQEV